MNSIIYYENIDGVQSFTLDGIPVKVDAARWAQVRPELSPCISRTAGDNEQAEFAITQEQVARLKVPEDA